MIKIIAIAALAAAGGAVALVSTANAASNTWYECAGGWQQTFDKSQCSGVKMTTPGTGVDLISYHPLGSQNDPRKIPLTLPEGNVGDSVGDGGN